VIRLLLAGCAFAALATPALADPNCLGSGGGVSLHVSGGVRIGNFSEADQMEFDRMRLRAAGIDAETAERTWLGCLKVTSRDASGSWQTDYYDPDTFERKPLDLTLPD
jgi:hypothetical protein